MSEKLRAHFDERLPRYTSYPTAPNFSPEINSATYSQWLTDLPSNTPASLYLHIPFCRSMCWYCGCHTTITAKDQPIVDYLSLLRKEIDMVSTQAGAPVRVERVHFGGGTPTIVEPADFIALAALLRDRFDFIATAEVAVEIDPRTLAAEMAAALGEAGVGRASLGVQSFDPVVQKAVNRIQSEEQTLEAVIHLRESGVERINFDLIYGLPHQTVRSCVESAEAAAAMKPDRFAVFGYAHIPSFKKHQRMIDEAVLPDGAARHEQALAIAETLVAAGYRQIGLDHFALPEDDMAQAQAKGTLRRNFQGYTTDRCETLLGFGASAIGSMGQGYVQNEVGLGHYADRIGTGRLATAKGYKLTLEDRVRANVIERLMCDFEVDVPSIAAHHAFDPSCLLEANEKLEALERDELLENKNGFIRVAEDRRFLVRTVAAAFDAYLAHSPRTYSRAV
ncbi:oxygen-independent coproporphyrinogen III oxidase [Mesorhizobium sp. A623]